MLARQPAVHFVEPISFTASGRAAVRRVLPYCQALGEAVSAEAPIQALERFTSRARDAQSASDAAWGAAVEATADLLPGDLAPRLETAHGEVLADLEVEAFLSGYFAGLAAARGGRR